MSGREVVLCVEGKEYYVWEGRITMYGKEGELCVEGKEYYV